jgi:hypothetical protein
MPQQTLPDGMRHLYCYSLKLTHPIPYYISRKNKIFDKNTKIKTPIVSQCELSHSNKENTNIRIIKQDTITTQHEPSKHFTFGEPTPEPGIKKTTGGVQINTHQEPDSCIDDKQASFHKSPTDHTAAQYYLIELGTKAGYGVWVASNDRKTKYNGKELGSNKGVLPELPTFVPDPRLQQRIGLIDILWIENCAVVAAFEVETTTSIVTGILRMSDLLALNPSITFDIYIVAPENREKLVKQHILRPAFNPNKVRPVTCKETNLSDRCGYISCEKLKEEVEYVQTKTRYNPQYLDDIVQRYKNDPVIYIQDNEVQ